MTCCFGCVEYCDAIHPNRDNAGIMSLWVNGCRLVHDCVRIRKGLGRGLNQSAYIDFENISLT